MFLITLVEKGGGNQQQLTFKKAEVTIGRLAGNDIVLGKGNVSKYHSRIVLKDGKFIIVDMKSTNGTYVNGKKIAAPQVVRPSDKIYIGDYINNVEAGEGDGAEAADEGEYTAERAQGRGDEEKQEEQQEEEEAPPEEDEAPASGGDKGHMPASMQAALARRKNKVDPAVEAYSRLQKDIHDRL